MDRFDHKDSFNHRGHREENRTIMQKHTKNYEHDALTHSIIGAAIEVHNELGPGLLENVYENALCIELSRCNIPFEKQKQIAVSYKGECVGDMYADLVIEGKVIVELKSVTEIAPIHKAQLLTYLKLAKIKTGLMINFNAEKLKQGVRRFSV